MTKKKKLDETAAAGSVGAHSVAVRFDSKRDNHPTLKRTGSFLDFMQQHGKKPANSFNPTPIEKPFKLKENVSLDHIYSKLSGIGNQSRMSEDNTQTYGVEDDEGNLMKITVRGDQQEEFEAALARELAEVEEYKMTGKGGYGRNVSMAEVLYNLKQNFDLVNVEFPEIPKDKVYNADKVSDPEDVETDLPDPEKNVGNADTEGQEDEELGDVDFGEEGEEEGEEDLESPESGEENEEEEDLGTEFGEEEGNEESMLKNIIQMLSAEAEARRATAEAEAEKSRALQAKYSMMAAQEEMENQEELARMEKEMEAQKEKEKEAKKLADLARFKMRNSVEEGYSSFGEYMTAILELDDADDQESAERESRDPTERRLRSQIDNTEKRLKRHKESKKRQMQRNQTDNENAEDRQIGQVRNEKRVAQP